MSTTTRTLPVMTYRQAGFITSLAATRAWFRDYPELADIVAAAANGGPHDFTVRDASAAIDAMLDCDYAGAPRSRAAAVVVTPGYHLDGDTVYAIVNGRQSGNMYAKRLVVTGGHARWDYQRGALARVASMPRLSIEDAARLGHLTGVCVCCGSPLTDPESVARGIGPVCGKNLAKALAKVAATPVSAPAPVADDCDHDNEAEDALADEEAAFALFAL